MWITRILWMALLGSALAGCAGMPHGGERVAIHDLRLLARTTTPEISSKFGISLDEVRRLVAVEARVEQAAGIHVDGFYLADSSEVNAYAMVRDGRSMVVISRSFVRCLANDEAAMASLIGHEITHLVFDHPAVRREQHLHSENGKGMARQALAPVAQEARGGASVSGTTAHVEHARSDEQEADLLGLDYAVRAGFEPNGALRLFAALPREAGGGGSVTHPANADRLNRLRAAIAEKYGQPLPPVPAG